MERCINYCGLRCVDGTCPNALAREYPDYGFLSLQRVTNAIHIVGVMTAAFMEKKECVN